MQHFLHITDLPLHTVEEILATARRLKRSRKRRREGELRYKTAALIFEGPSTRTRISFGTAMRECGGAAIYISPEEYRELKAEHPSAWARELSLYVDVIAARIYDHEYAMQLAGVSCVPVINGMSNQEHPCQALADALTMLEVYSSLRGLHLTCVGESPVYNSLLILASALGAHVTIACPPGADPSEDVLQMAEDYNPVSQGSVRVVRSIEEGATGADVIYADTWYDPVDSRTPEEEAYWVTQLTPFQVNQRVMDMANPKAVFMHCLPAHRGEEVTEEVLLGRRSMIYPQAENRLHAQKALLLHLLME